VVSTGDAVLLAALLGVSTGELVTALAAALAAVSFVLRWGVASLEGIAGAQSVLGPAGVVGPELAAASSWCAAAALVVVSPRGWRAAAFGLAAAISVAGPTAATTGDVVVRTVASVAGVGAAVAAGRLLPANVAGPIGLVLAGAAATMALAA
jgi:hypothetical protein